MTENLFFDEADLKSKKRILFCIPYGGGWSTMFRVWEKYFDDETLLLPVKFPGRGERLDEESFSDMEELVKNTAPIIAEYDIPFGFYGGCFGGLCSYEIMKYLEKNFHKKSKIFYTNSLVSPKFITNENPLGNLPDEVLTKELLKRGELPEEILGDEEVLEFLLPGIRADYKIYEKYNYEDTNKINTNIHIFYNSEHYRNIQKYENWRDLTTKEVTMEFIDYKNLFDEKAQLEIAERISNNWKDIWKK